MASIAPAGPSAPEGKETPAQELMRSLREAVAAAADHRAEDEAKLAAIVARAEAALESVARVTASPVGSPPSPAPPSAPVLVGHSSPTTAGAPAPAPSPPTASAAAPTASGRVAVVPPAPAGFPTAQSAGLTSRARLIEIHSNLQELDRLIDPDAILEKLWGVARAHGLRVLVMHENGRALNVVRAEGFASFDGERHRRMGKATVPYEEDNLFGILSAERAMYSGPRPTAVFPVDLALMLGKRTPGWVLVIPIPLRSRWGRFFYAEAEVSELEGALMLDALAQCALRQMRAAQYHRHQPSERTRAVLDAALAERRKWTQRASARASDPPLPGSSRAVQPVAQVPAPSADPASQRFATLAQDLKAPPEPAVPSAADDERWAPLRVARPAGRLQQGRAKPPQAGELLAKVGDLPAMPHVTARALALLQSPQTTVHQVQELIGQDQALTTKLLHVANSSLYGGSREVVTIGEAVMRLGFRQIRSWMVATAARNVFLKNETTYVLRILWQHSVIGALAAQLIGARSGQVDPDEAFLGGLMHNIGLLLLARNHPDVMAELHSLASQEAVGYHEIERRLLGYDHADLGGVVLHAWRLGDRLTEAVSAHHRLAEAGTARPFAAVINLAEALALRMGRGPTETAQTDLSQSEAAQTLRLDADAIAQLTDQLARLLLDSKLFT